MLEASLTVSGGQEFHFSHCLQISINSSYFSLKLYLFSSSFWPAESRPDTKGPEMGTMAESLEFQFRLYLYLNLNF